MTQDHPIASRNYIMGRNPIIFGLLDALHIPREGVTGIDLIIDHRAFARAAISAACARALPTPEAQP
jgi:hypothetical protein